LIQPHGADCAAVVSNQCFEDLEARPARRAQPAGHDLTRNRRLLPWLQACDRPKVTAIFVPDRKALEQVLNRVQPDALQVCGSVRPDAFEEL
jgi:hypothetical protein